MYIFNEKADKQPYFIKNNVLYVKNQQRIQHIKNNKFKEFSKVSEDGLNRVLKTESLIKTSFRDFKNIRKKYE